MGDFNLKIWAKKCLYGAGAVAGSAAIVYVLNYIETTDIPTEYAIYASILTVVLTLIGNAIKHTTSK